LAPNVTVSVLSCTVALASSADGSIPRVVKSRVHSGSPSRVSMTLSTVQPPPSRRDW
jgi:hypothetical protein